MIISPPFLPDGDVTQDQSDDTFVDGLMIKTGEGNFPISYYLQWHGGIHLKAPSSKSLVRAIADGKVLYVRQPEEKPKDYPTLEKHPLYNDLDGWTDNGCVVIQHDTEIGEELAVTFYSIYMHLGSIETTVKQGADIHRKGKIGKAGIISDKEDQIHFEIIADEANTKRFIGDLAFSAPSYHTNQYGCEQAFRAQSGRTDACFGSMYFYIPKFIPLYDEPDASKQIVSYPVVQKTQSADTSSDNQSSLLKKETTDSNNPLNMTSSFGADTSPYQLPNMTNTSQQPETQFLTKPIVKTVGENLYVEMVFTKGKCTFITYDEHGVKLRAVSQSGDSSYSGQVHEYNLYKASLKLYPSKPTAGFELLRFGRVIGDEDFEEAETTTHFRQIYTPNGTHWIDLNNKYIKKYSDADFPYWKGWGVVSDDTDGDGRCDSTIVTSILAKKWTKLSQGGSLNQIDSNQRAKDEWYVLTNDATIKEKLKRIFYKFPTEWSMTDFDTRYAWVKKDIYENAEKSFEKFKNFAQALSFWDESGIPIDKNHWHFPPIEFIKHFRKCSWLSDGELKQLLPVHVIRDAKDKKTKTVTYHYDHVAEQYNRHVNRLDNLSAMRIHINKALRKYCIDTPIRMACFFGNALQETGWFSTLGERNANHGGWEGRGLLQLTFDYNYYYYWYFRGLTTAKTLKDFKKEENNAQYSILKGRLTVFDQMDPVDSAGCYWSQAHGDKQTTECANYFADQMSLHVLERRTRNTVEAGSKIYYRSMAFWHTTASVNLPGHVSFTDYDDGKYKGLNGFTDRCCAYAHCLALLTEKKFPSNSNPSQIILEFPEGYERRNIHGKEVK